MTPQTDREWAKALAVVHPDRTGDAAPFVALQAGREQWRKAHPGDCRVCGQPIDGTRTNSTNYCGLVCSSRAKAKARQQPKALKSGGQSRRQTIIAPGVLHAKHAAVFGPLATCQHTACVRARRR